MARWTLFVAALLLAACQQESSNPIGTDADGAGNPLSLAACTAAPSDLVSWWPGDGHPNDIAGYNHGTLQNGATYATGNVGQAFDLDGSNDYVSIPNESSFDFTTAITVEGWIKVDSWTSPYAPILSKGDSAWRVQRAANTNFLAFGTSGLSNVDLDGDVNVNDGAWHHVAAVFDGSTKYLYVDGNLDASAGVTGSIATNDLEVRIGNNSQETTRFWDGQIDELTVYDSALSEEEIDAIVAAGADGKCKPSCLGRTVTTTGTVNGSGQIELTAGSDVWVGTAAGETALGLGGNDWMCGVAGADSLSGGEGDDRLSGGNDADVVLGDNGADRMQGDAGADVLEGAADDDVLDGGTEADSLYGGTKANPYLAGSNNDRLQGGDHDDLLHGGDGIDVVNGGGGHDDVYGDEDGDTVTGGPGDDELEGGPGNDLLRGDAGADAFSGGDDADKARAKDFVCGVDTHDGTVEQGIPSCPP